MIARSTFNFGFIKPNAQCQTNGNHDETAATRAAPSVASLGIFRGGGM